MSLESDTIANLSEERAVAPGRRTSTERRGKDRRKPGTRINPQAPRRSFIKVIGAGATGTAAALFAIVVLASIKFDGVGATPVLIAGGGAFLAVLVLMLGSLEQRLIEIRLELMMMNGGVRQADRRKGDRRENADPAETERRAR
ncbi:MAG: hypothetical protein EOO83_00205 [Oxalobacteraceae bacterium]|nr:MAG: hypothetical protein EOO83_00205 [Oxalobacteraceae bacterium]